MHVIRLGSTPLKGMEHVSRPHIELTPGGLPDDRLFCLLDTETGRVLRTAGHDSTMACRADWNPPVLTVRTPLGTAAAEVADGRLVTGDYWGRDVDLVTVDGPWSALLSRYIARPVQLCRTRESGAVIWGGAVSLVTTSSLAELARRTGRAHDDGARFRPTLVVDTGAQSAFAEDAWVGTRLRVGTAVVTVRGTLPRCAVVDRRPGAGGLDVRVLAALSPDRARSGEIAFGVHGDVQVPGRVAVGDTVELS